MDRRKFLLLLGAAGALPVYRALAEMNAQAGGAWWEACASDPNTPTPWPVQSTYTPEPTPTCRPTATLQPNPSPTPYPTSTPYPTQPAGRVFYVDATLGDDANDGLAADRAWRTVGKVNAATFEPGDWVLFKRGETWRGASEYLYAPSSGAPGNPIYFGAYGSGGNPIFDACEEYNDFTLDAGAIWQHTALFYDPGHVFEDGVRLFRKTAYVDLVAGSYYYNDVTDILYVWCSDSGNPNTGHVIEFPSYWQAPIDFNGQSHLVFDGIDITRARWNGYNVASDVSTGSVSCVIRDCVTSWHNARGISCGTHTDANIADMLFENVIAHDCNGEGIWIGNGDRITARNCEVYNINVDRDKNYLGDGGGILVGIRSVDCVVEDCSIHDIYYAVGLLVEFEATFDRPINTILQRNLINGNVSGGSPGAQLQLQGSNTIARNNIITAAYTHAIQINNGATGEKVYHNTVYQDDSDGWCLIVLAGTNIDVRNNVFYLNGNGYVHRVDVAGQTGVTIDYNQEYGDGTVLYNWEGGTPAYPSSFASWQTVSSQDANSDNGDPDFVTPGSNFHLQSTSPCLGAGATGLGVVTDYDGVTRGSPPDIGAYEYVGV